eukprot:CAMPEP_0202908432 /NCGR_PEP_ID=MMETSP1392-20130828/45977_1 /ASSEMBLY_ACC=CAM_ASM_000868 /TAXON_ID=225041 /ORGANISM="Chlamydomonas chlamydogama, Strain SAG 11-48b" /LENGTH=108 /DNA_ID=CAMNT_0049597759 /DNA_START=284 /DNA_END=607 /DNA_ORIENTATION=+
MTGQVTLFPTYLAACLTYLGVLEGRSLSEAWNRAQPLIVPTCIAGTVFWPIANIINFRYIGPSQRVLYVNAAGLLWNTFLSFMNSSQAVQAPVAAAGGSAAAAAAGGG